MPTMATSAMGHQGMSIDPPINDDDGQNESSEGCRQVTTDDGQSHAGIRNRPFVPLASSQLAASQHRPHRARYVFARFSDEECTDDPMGPERSPPTAMMAAPQRHASREHRANGTDRRR